MNGSSKRDGLTMLFEWHSPGSMLMPTALLWPCRFENHWRQVWVHSGELHNGRPRFQMEKNPAWWIYMGDDGHW